MAVHFADHHPQRGAAARSGGAQTVALTAAGAAALAVACTVSPTQVENGPVLCPFRLATGLPCPGCGLTRSWVFVAHGHFGNALRANPFGLVTMAAAVALIAVVGGAVIRRRPIPPMSPLVRSRPFLFVFACWMVFAVVRIAFVATG